jgi:FKBP-type peptidyl-prolyl cis-trans isomerase SlyD
VKVAAQKVVLIDYTLKDDAGRMLDSSEGKKPLAYLHGAGNIVPGLERALEGQDIGASLDVDLTPADGYGEYDPRLVQNVAVRKLPERKAQVGQQLRVSTPDGQRIVTVKAVRGDYATLDANHPLAGQNLHFKVSIVEVREPTEEETAHGHVHGEGGHAH